MIEVKELLKEREALNQERTQKLKEEGLNVQKDNNLLKQKHKLKRKERNLLELAKRAEFNPRYNEEYERLLIRKDYLREHYRLVKFF
ncbi:MAG: hypothetical protein KGD67_08570 [Candidatus Lokiarchaeota archaeon]|nr:hypothetical protein [Candidatus Lokiarchaeota archaeon]